MMRNMFKRLFLLFSATGVLMYPAAAPGHGVQGVVEGAQGFLVSVSYDDGEPMSYAAVEIKCPDAGPAFQTGRTDRNGRIMFRPDRSGPWQVVVKDGVGHMVALELNVADADEASLAQIAARTGGGRGGGGIVAGLSIIFGAAGFLYGWNARRKTTRAAGRAGRG